MAEAAAVAPIPAQHAFVIYIISSPCPNSILVLQVAVHPLIIRVRQFNACAHIGMESCEWQSWHQIHHKTEGLMLPVHNMNAVWSNSQPFFIHLSI